VSKHTTCRAARSTTTSVNPFEAQPNIVFAALAITTGSNAKPFGASSIRPDRTPLPHCPDQGRPTNLDAADPLPDDLRDTLKMRGDGVH